MRGVEGGEQLADTVGNFVNGAVVDERGIDAGGGDWKKD